MQKFFLAGILVLLILVLNNCKKETESITNSVEDDTTDNRWIVYKPNIYIYPQHETNLTVQLIFPNGGEIIESIPEYNTGWSVSVKPSGQINNEYEYLFYEAQIPKLLQKDFGWIIKGSQLDSFFTNNLQSLEFSTNEIKDFTDYWIPLLDTGKNYIMYPQFNEELLILFN